VSGSITHSRAFELLPWLANGSLAAAERDAVEQHVRSCLSCHRELKEQQRLRVAVRAQPTIHLSAQTGYERLTRALGGEPLLPEPRRVRPLDRFVRFATVAAAGLAVAAILLWIVPSPRGTGNTAAYETLATEQAHVTGDLDVVFVHSITAAEMQALLTEIGASIAGGPSEAGRYTIRLDDSSVTNAELDDLLARLAADPRIRFAGRALGGRAK
jgi:Putative zinc-finger